MSVRYFSQLAVVDAKVGATCNARSSTQSGVDRTTMYGVRVHG
jgi:hypothetical protein